MFKVEDIVEIIDPDAYFYGAIGVLRAIEDEEAFDEYCYYVQFEMIDDDTGEDMIYDDCYYTVNQIKLFKGEC